MNSRSALSMIVTWIVSISFIVSNPVRSLFDYPDVDDRLPPPNNNHMFDLSCDPCTPGWGVKTLCNRTSNTVCAPCPAGTWSPKRPHFRPCSPCSKCGEGLYEDIPCANNRDTKCDSCANVKGHLNEDYKRKCDWRRAPESLKPPASEELYEEEEEEVDEDDEQYYEEDQEDSTKSRDDEHGNGIATAKNGDRRVPIFSEEAIRNRITTLGNAALDKFGQIKQRLENEADLLDGIRWSEVQPREEVDDEIRAKPHIMRPLPRMMPRNGPIRVEDSWEDVSEADGDEKRVAVNFPPSYHDYPINQLMHPNQRKGLILMLLTAFVVITGVAVIILYVIVYNRRRHRSTYDRVQRVELSPEEREIVRNSANRLGQIARPVKRFQFAPFGFKPLVNAESDLSLSITENPLESYLRNDYPDRDHTADSVVASDSPSSEADSKKDESGGSGNKV